MTNMCPITREELFEALQSMPDNSRVLAGGTDLIIKMQSGACEPDALLYLGNLEETRQIRWEENVLYIGASVTMYELQAAFCDIPAFCAIADAAADVGSPQIRSKATIGGNVMNASPAGDLIPVLCMYDAKAEIAGADGKVYSISIEKLILGPGKTALRPREAVLGFSISRARWSGYKSAFWKLGFRYKVAISRIGVAAAVTQQEDGTIAEANVHIGAISGTPVRLEEAEAYLVGKTLNEDTIHRTGQYLSDQIRKINVQKFYKRNAAYGVMEDALLRLQERCK